MKRRMSCPSNGDGRHWVVNERTRVDEGQGLRVLPTCRLVYILPSVCDLPQNGSAYVLRLHARMLDLERNITQSADKHPHLCLSKRRGEEQKRNSDQDVLGWLCEFRVLQGRRDRSGRLERQAFVRN